MGSRFEEARHLIYKAHDEDPNKCKDKNGQEIAYESHYATKMENYLSKRDPQASDVLKLAICGQHFRRWEVPRSDFPMTKIGYHSWRTHLKKRQGEQVAQIMKDVGYPDEDVERCKSFIQKEGLKQGGDVQVLEDVACLVFLDDQFDEFKEKHDEDKIITILRKTWVKMSKEGQDMALEIPMTDECKSLVAKALQS